MNKKDFLDKLKNGLKGLPETEIDERLNFYSEMIDDRIEEGLTEDEAVSQIGCIDDVISQIVSETPLSNLVKEKVKPKRALKIWEIVLLVIGAPLWLSVLITLFSVFLSIYITVWSVIVTFWAVGASIVACSLAAFVASVAFIMGGNQLAGIAIVGVGIALAGISIFFFFGCKLATKGCIFLTKKIVQGIKYLFIKGVNE